MQTVAAPDSAAASASEPGRGHVMIARSGLRSVVTRSFATSPLRLLTPTNHGHAAWVFTSTYGGGMVDGERASLRIDVGRGASAYMSTQASTKIYKSPRGTTAQLTARVADGGVLVLVPDPVACFAGARYHQRQEFDLAGGGSLVLVDSVSCGRRAFGERWAFTEYVSRIVVRRHGRLLAHDAVALRAGDGDLAERCGRFDALATVIVAGPLGSDHRPALAEMASPALARRASMLLAVAPLGESGCIIRMAGTSVEDVSRTIRRCLSFVPPLLGDDPWARKW